MRVSALLACSAVSCLPELPELRYETDHLLIGTDFSEPVCQGSLDLLEAHLVWVSEQLGVERDLPLELYWYEEVPESLCSFADGPAAGCYDPDEDRVFTTFDAAPHELAHGVAGELGRADEFFAEGFATAFDGQFTQFGLQAPTLGVGLTAGDVDYSGAAHFVRWLHAEHGAEPLRRILRTSSPSRGARHAARKFEEAYGESLDAVQTRYYAEGPELQPDLRGCAFPEVEPVDGVFDVHLELECTASHTRGVTEMTRVVTFEIARSSWYVLEVQSPAQALVRVCYDRLVPKGEDQPRDVVLPVGEMPGSMFWFPPEWIPAGVQELWLAAGRYRIDVRVDRDHSGGARFRLHERIGVPP